MIKRESAVRRHMEMRQKEKNKKAFLFLTGIISDFPKYRMLGILLEEQQIEARRFMRDKSRLSGPAVYRILRDWEKAGLVQKSPGLQERSAFRYTLNGKWLLERLS